MWVPPWPAWWPWWLNQNDLFTLGTGAVATFFSQFGFNQSAFLGNVAMRQAQVYQEKNYNLAWVGIARSDIASMLSLTVQRINNYMLVATLILTIAANYIVSVSFPAEASQLVVSACGLSFAVSVIWFSVSIMFAVKGQNSAFTNTMRMLTWEIRPENPQPYGHDYLTQAQFMERFQGLFRMPGLKACFLQPQHNQTTDPAAAKERIESELEALGPPTKELLYYARYAKLMELWEPYDLKSKYCIGLGLYSLTQGAAYYSLGSILYDGSVFSLPTAAAVVTVMVYINLVLLGQGLENKANGLLAYILFATGPVSATFAVALPQELIVTQLFNPLIGFSQFLLYALSLCVVEIMPLASNTHRSNSTQRYIEGPHGQDFGDQVRTGADLTWDGLHEGHVREHLGEHEEEAEQWSAQEVYDLNYVASYDQNEAGASLSEVREHVDGIMRSALILCMALWVMFALSTFVDGLGAGNRLFQEFLPQVHLDEVEISWGSQALQLRSIACGSGEHAYASNGFVLFDINLAEGTAAQTHCHLNGSVLDVTVKCEAGQSLCTPVALVQEDSGGLHVVDCQTDVILPILQEEEPLRRFSLSRSMNSIAVGLYSSSVASAPQTVVEFVEYAKPVGLKPLWALVDVGATAVDITLVDQFLWIFNKDSLEIRKDGQIIALDSFDDVKTIVSGCVISGKVTHTLHTTREKVKGMVLTDAVPPKLYTFSCAPKMQMPLCGMLVSLILSYWLLQ